MTVGIMEDLAALGHPEVAVIEWRPEQSESVA
jgi:hypothetical protein